MYGKDHAIGQNAQNVDDVEELKRDYDQVNDTNHKTPHRDTSKEDVSHHWTINCTSSRRRRGTMLKESSLQTFTAITTLEKGMHSLGENFFEAMRDLISYFVS